MKLMHVIMAVLFLVLAAGIFLYTRTGKEAAAPGDRKTYQSDKLELKFSYPKNYFLAEEEINTAQRYHARVTLMEDTEENRLVREGKAPGRDGPPVITIDVYQNNLDKQTAENWIKNTGDSNFKLGAGKLVAATVGGLPAYAYGWSGLYEGESIVTANDNYVYMFSVNYLSPEDRIMQDFRKILAAVEIIK